MLRLGRRMKMEIRTFRVAEIVETIEGEGWWTGLPITLLRFQGCNIHCSFCDTLYALDESAGQLMSLGELFKTIEKFHPKGRAILLTGGEPLIQPLEYLVPPLTFLGPVHLETNGILPLDNDLPFAWITVSPKPPHEVHPTTLGRADEIKWLVGSEADVAALCLWLEEHKDAWLDFKRITVQPISQDTEATKIAIAACLKYNWRLSIQVHKLLNIA